MSRPTVSDPSTGPGEPSLENARLTAENKELRAQPVYVRMTGCGQHGPLAHSAEHDIGYIALTGELPCYRHRRWTAADPTQPRR
ncbi:hypothetical protein OPAG_06880 [Rhodococcus opacus PD630]|nr:hypothetical protein OPAG_06880 [Rhodococcus opacus PD630]